MTTKEQALEYFNRIPDGHRNAIQRPWNKYVDRSLRRMIEKANNNGDCIINIGEGIYRPIPGDTVDEAELNRYFNTEKKREKSINSKVAAMSKTFEGWRDSAIYADCKRKIRQFE